MNNQKVSVIIPMYNAQKYIRTIIQDVINQTYNNLEILVIDDGSVDESAHIVESIAKLDSRVKLYRLTHEGVSNARNYALEKATGSFIRFLDADDRIARDSIEMLVNAMINHEVQLVIGGFDSVPGKQLYNGKQLQIGELTIREYCEDFIKYSRSFYYGALWNKLYRRDLIVDNGIKFDSEISWCEDFLFNLDYIQKITKCFRLDSKHSIYTYCNNGMSVTNNLKKEEIERIDKIKRKKVFSICDESMPLT